MAKRARPEFYWDAKRKQWRKTLKHPVTGKWSVSVYGNTKAELRENVELKKAELAELQAANADGNAQNLKVFEYAQQWYKLNAPGVVERTRSGYRTVINKHICPVIGDLELAAVTADDAKRVVAVATEQDLAKETQKKIINVLKKMFADAEDAGKIKTNPCRRLTAKGRATIKKKALTREQQKTVVDALADEPIGIFVQLCLFCGLRREEALGLMWEDVHMPEDGKAPWIEVCRTCTWPHNQPVIEAYAKSAAGHRKLALPDVLAARLKVEPRTSPYVCHTVEGKPYSEASFRKAWAAVTNRVEHSVTYKRRDPETKVWREVTTDLKLGDPVPYKDYAIAFDFSFTPHMLRHTYITELVYANVPLKTVQYLAGHATPTITLQIYADIMLNKPDDTLGAVNESFKHFQVQMPSSSAAENAPSR